ncbi:hypothetical protein I9W82_002607 [Candida metapsilosis]|uniref:Cell wall mannoprotein PIR1-like C-terminal domain-containing protein n=1 Tax=Candida metapsilosis TaxID=273372 RepID=A0A8H8DE57_9ASCO|nr:hypothetical protein I9W82_002607 [Candida metapsilosis]
MQYSAILSVAFALISTSQAGYVRPRPITEPDCEPTTTPCAPPTTTTPCPPTTTSCRQDSDITLFSGEFALGVKELCDEDDVVYLVFELPDGQLEHNGVTVDCGCHPTTTPCAEPEPITDCDDKEKRWYKPKPKPTPTPTPSPYGLSNLCHPYCSIAATSDCTTDFFTLCDSVLKDGKYRTGEIVANHQFQFDSPVQPDALYNKGWSIEYKDDYYLLALNECTTFWECPVDDCGLWKLYDASIDSKCKEIEIVIIFKDEECD